MSRFRNVLYRAQQQLDIAEPARSRILLEMANDLEDAYEHYLSQGHDEAEAERLAEESFAVSDQALQHLARIHDKAFRNVGDSLAEHVGGTWQKLLLILILGFEIVLAGRILTDASFRMFTSPFVWPLVTLALVAFLITIWKIYQILASSKGHPRRWRTGPGALLFIAGLSLATAGTGFLFHLQRFLRLNYAEAPKSLFMNFAGFAVGLSSMMTIGLLTSIFAALVWFVLTSLVSRSERRELESLLAEPM